MAAQRQWRHFLSRWAVGVVVVVLALPVTFFTAVGIAGNAGLSQEYTELAAALNAGPIYRLAMLFDALSWVGMGGTVLLLGAITLPAAPVRGLLGAACGLASVIGVVGGFLRLIGTTDLAMHYAAGDAAAQSAALASFVDLRRVINSVFLAGDLLQGAGFLLVASGALTAHVVPRRLAYAFMLLGVITLLFFTINAAGGPFLFPLLLVIILVVATTHVWLARALWRPGPAPDEALTAEPIT